MALLLFILSYLLNPSLKTLLYAHNTSGFLGHLWLPRNDVRFYIVMTSPPEQGQFSCLRTCFYCNENAHKKFRNRFQHWPLVGGKASGVKWDRAPQNPTVRVCVRMHMYLYVHASMCVCVFEWNCVCSADESACVECICVYLCLFPPAFNGDHVWSQQHRRTKTC